MTIEEIEKRMAELPPGGITYKTIKGKRYAYYQWTEDGKQHARRVKDDELETLQALIDERKSLKCDLAELTDGQRQRSSRRQSSALSSMLVRTGDALATFAAPVASWRRRRCYEVLAEYLQGDTDGRVLILYGLRRTGKTTLIRQALASMDEAQLRQSAFVQVREKDTLAELNALLRELEAQGVRYVFIDEVTLAEDFIEGAALLSDIYAASGMKIVLSGTDSLGFLFAEDEQLYDRCYLVHTTYIPYAEFSSVLGMNGIDAYIEYGGTMSVGGANYNEEFSLFSGSRRTNEYIDSAIARNIQHSLRNYQYGTHFRGLTELHENDELTSVINRVVEDINHRFTLEVLSRDFRSHDLGVARTNLRKDRLHPQTTLDSIDVAGVTERLKRLLEIRDSGERMIALAEAHSAEIEEYLELLDVIEKVSVVNAADYSSDERVIISQPGLRYAQAKALVAALMQDSALVDLAAAERQYVTGRVLEEVRGRMMEDVVLLETKIARPQCEVFALRFAIGEFDMVVADPERLTCELYEVKHSDKRAAAQRRHLLDAEKCARAEHRWGTINRKAVIYRGERDCEEGVEYLNVEDYLTSL